MRTRLLTICALLSCPFAATAQFVDRFDGPKVEGWFTIAGDGDAVIEVEQRDGVLRMNLDATADRHNVWWTCIKRDISSFVDLRKLKNPKYELRVEAKVRPSHAPRRVNFMINTQRTTNFHEHLREYELADTTHWRTISMTTRDLDVVPGDSLFVQLCATDWGPGRYHVEVDEYRADVVRRDRAADDDGEPLVYHPPVPDLESFTHHIPVAHDSVIDAGFPQVNFNDWHITEHDGEARVLTVSSSQWIVLRWDYKPLLGMMVDGSGVLELTTASLAIGGDYISAFGQDLGEEFGKVRVIEILGGDPDWDQRTVTYESLLRGAPYEEVFNTQMVIDLELASRAGEKSLFTLPRPVVQRLLDGTTKGLLIRPLGALVGSVYASEDASGRGPKLHFTHRSTDPLRTVRGGF